MNDIYREKDARNNLRQAMTREVLLPALANWWEESCREQGMDCPTPEISVSWIEPGGTHE